LAFCWAHVRRDFVAVARSWPEQEGWALGWVGRIGEVYRRKDARCAAREEAAAFAAADARLRAAVTALGAQGEAELADPGLHPAAWLTAYLTACAEAGGTAPAAVERFLPWNLSDEERRRWPLAGAADGDDTS